jgi:NhaP-type Na+/H+ or K+/H+ antiporter
MSDNSSEVVLCLFVVLIVGAAATYLISRFAPQLPYTVVIFAIGIIAAVIIDKHSDDILEHSILLWNSIDPELVLYLFLPALLFGEAMGLNYHHVKGALPASIMLAGPGAVIGALAIAGLVYITFPYKWNWSLCLLFGAITCATDPVGKFIRYAFVF